jgi:hypothetical protein
MSTYCGFANPAKSKVLAFMMRQARFKMLPHKVSKLEAEKLAIFNCNLEIRPQNQWPTKAAP